MGPMSLQEQEGLVTFVADNTSVEKNGTVKGPHDYKPLPPTRQEAVRAMEKICGTRICGGINEKKK